MVRYFGHEPLYGIWTLSILSSALKFLALRAVVGLLVQRTAYRILAIAAIGCFMSSFVPTNGDLAMLGSLVILSMTLSAIAERPPIQMLFVVALVAAALLLGSASARWSPLLFLAVVAAACFLPLMYKSSAQTTLIVAIVLATIAIVPLHRSSIAFVPLAVGSGAAFVAIRQWTAPPRFALSRGLGVTTLVLTVLAAFVVLGLFAWVVWHPEQDLRKLESYRWVLQAVLRRDFLQDTDVLLGSGPKVALFELGRAMSPAFVLTAGLFSLAAWRHARQSPGDPSTHFAEAHGAMIAWIIAVVVGCVLLLGVPFSYRSGFLVVAFMAVSLTLGFSVLVTTKVIYQIAWPLLLLLAIYVLCGLAVVHCFFGPDLCRDSSYVGLFKSQATAIGSVVLVTAVVGLIFGSLLQRWAAQLIGACLILTFTFEFGLIKAYFMPYAYGRLESSPTSRAVSHLSHEEIELSRDIRQLGSAVVVVSDPFTMSNIRALTGLNSLVTFSNLDTMSPTTAAKLREWIRGVLTGSHGTCSLRTPLSIVGGLANAAEFNYWLARRTSLEPSGRRTLRRFGYLDSFLLTPRPDIKPADERTDHKWLEELSADKLRYYEDDLIGTPMILLVINRKTLAWSEGGGSVGYFPNVGELDTGFIDDLARRCDVRVYDRRFVLVRFPMTTAAD